MLRVALTKLSPEHREIIDLVYYHEKSVDDAADILSIPRATVKTRMFYARKKLGGDGAAGSIRQRNQLPRRRIEGHDLVGHVPPYPARPI